MAASDSTMGRLARPDSRPLLVTLVVAGWLILCGFGGLRALVVLGSVASAAWYGVQDPMVRLAMQDSLRSLELRLAGPLLLVALFGGYGAIRLLRRQRWSRTLLLCVGLLAIATTRASRPTR